MPFTCESAVRYEEEPIIWISCGFTTSTVTGDSSRFSENREPTTTISSPGTFDRSSVPEAAAGAGAGWAAGAAIGAPVGAGWSAGAGAGAEVAAGTSVGEGAGAGTTAGSSAANERALIDHTRVARTRVTGLPPAT